MMDDTASSSPHRRLSGLQAEALLSQGLISSGDREAALLFPGFEIITLLGRGGMGAVYLARQVSLDREVALKVLNQDLANDPLFLERLEREAQTMARLRHPNVVAVHDFQRNDAGAAIIMEFIEGGSLRDWMRQHPYGAPVDETLTLIQQAGAGLSAAHAAGVVHRDMKPENILLDHQGNVRVTDFGLAVPMRGESARLTLSGTTVGTVDYMAPEQMRGGEVDARADIYALGVLLYEMLTGHTPRGNFDPPAALRPELPAHLSEAIMKALRPLPAERFATVDELWHALLTPGRHASRSRLRLGLLLGLAALSCAAVLMFASRWLPGAASQPTAPILSANKTVAAPWQEYDFGPWRDALAGVDVQGDAISGEWTRQGGSVTSGNGICILELLRDDMPVSYDLRTTFTRLSGADSVAVFTWINASLGSCEFDAWRLGLAGLQLIEGVSLEQGDSFRFPLENGRRYELLLEVRPAFVRFIVDGVEVKTYRLGNHEHCWPPSPWGWPLDRPRTRMALASYQSPTQFDQVEWRAARLAVRQ